MPEMYFTVRWPDNSEQQYYSPSLVVHDFLHVGESYQVEDFLLRVEEAMRQASDRVKGKYGFACTSAIETVRAVSMHAVSAHTAAQVTVVAMTGGEYLS